MSTTSAPGTDPCRARLERDLRSAGVEAGVAAGQWRVVDLAWPALIVAISLGDDREVGMKVEVEEYPLEAPAGVLWDLDADAPLPVPDWPTTGRTPEVFRTEGWDDGRDGAPYLGCDRPALKGHPGWPSQHPERCWNSGRTIEFYFREMHRELAGARPRRESA